MLKLYLSGETLESIGKRYGVSRQRVDQILDLTSAMRAHHKAAVKKKKKQSVEKMMPEIVKRYKSGTGYVTLANQYKLPAYIVKDCLKSRKIYIKKRQFSRRKWPEDVMLDYLRLLGYSIGRAPTMDEMDSYRGPWAAVFVKYFGSWSSALQAAGFDARKPGRAMLQAEEIKFRRNNPD